MVWTQLIASKTRVRLLEYLFTHPAEKVYLRGLERLLNEPATPIRRELQKLEEMGLLKSAFEANVKYYALDVASQAYQQLRPLIIPPPAVAAATQQPAVIQRQPAAGTAGGGIIPGTAQPSVAVSPVAAVSTKPELEPVLISVKRRDELPSWGWAVAGLIGVAVIFTLMSAVRTQRQLAMVQQQLQARTARPVTVQVMPPQEPVPNESRSQRWRVMPGNWTAVAPAESGVKDGQSY